MIDRITILIFLATSLVSKSKSWKYDSSLECQGAYSEYCFNGPASTVEHATFDDAMFWCRNKSSQLAVISDSETQDAASRFLDSWNISSTNLVYINTKLRMVDRIDWTWYLVNGSKFYGYFKDQGYEVYKVYNSLQYASNYISIPDLARLGPTPPQWWSSGSKPDEHRQYICNFNGSACSLVNNSFLHNNKCYVKYENDSVTWFEARKRCISDGGDLAKFDYPDCCYAALPFNTSVLNRSLSYWVGIRYNNLTWMSPADSQNESMFYNWSSGKPNNFNYSCVCLDPNGLPRWSWTDCDCNVSRPFLCLTRIQTTTPMSTATTQSMMAADSKSQIMDEKTRLIVGVVVGAGGGLIVLVIVIIVVACIIAKRRKREPNGGNEDQPTDRRMPRTGEYLDAQAIRVFDGTSAANDPDKVPNSEQHKKENGRTISKPTGLYGEVIPESGYSQDSLGRADYDDTTYDGLEFCDKNEDKNSIFKSKMQTMYVPEDPSHVYENYTE